MAQTKKSNQRRNILLAGVALISGVALFARKRQALKNLDYRIVDVKFQKINNLLEVLALKVKLILEVNNPSSTSLGFKSFVGNITYNGSLLGNFKLYDPIDLTPQKSTRIEIPVTASTISLLGELFLSVKNGELKPVDVNGLLKVGAMDIPVHQTVNFSY